MIDLPEDTLARLHKTGSATVATMLFKRGFRNASMRGVKPLGGAARTMAGEAFTVRNIPAREDLDVLAPFDGRERLQARAFDTCPPGQVFVVDCRGETEAAFGGGIFLSRLAAKGAAGMVSDGAVRDSAEIASLDLPIFCAGVAPPPSLVLQHVAEIGVPIGCGGVAVYPGDVIVGDGDGVVVIPRACADEIADAALEQQRYDRFAVEQIRAGKPVFGTYPPDEAMQARFRAWLDKRR
ncbi:MAG: ribonuclease activity regulator RraA [Burkholderiales bacterium]